MRPYRGNRVGLAVVGLALAAAGLYGFLRGEGRLPWPRGERLLPRGLPAHAAEHPWAGWVAALLLTALALLSIRWLIRAVGLGRWGSRSGSATAMLGVALKEIEGLSRIRVRWVKCDRLRISVTCGPSSDLAKLVARLNRDAVGKVRRTVGDDDLGAVVRLHVGRR